MSDPAAMLGWRGRAAVDLKGATIGRIQEIYVNRETKFPEWSLVRISLFGNKSSFMPLAGSSADGDRVRVPFTREQVRDAPWIKADGSLSPEDGASLYAHFGINDGQSLTHHNRSAAPRLRSRRRPASALLGLVAARLGTHRGRGDSLDVPDRPSDR
jgi:hypothetical protein